MKRNVKILAWALITAMTAASIWVSFANDSSSGTTNSWTISKKFERQELTEDQRAEMEIIKQLLDKQKAWETLTNEEQAQLDEFKANMPERWEKWRGWFMWKGWESKWWFINNLTTEEKTALESMTNEEKKVFFEAKRAEMQAKKESHESVIDKLLAWEKLTADEELIRAEIIKERAERKARELEENTNK